MRDEAHLRERLKRGLVVGVAVAGAVVGLSAAGVLEPAELITYDWRTRIVARERPPAESEVVLVMVDEESLDWALEEFGYGWPWPREIWGAMLQYFDEAGAQAVGFDILFPDFSPYGVSDDAYFARAASDYGRTVHAAFYGRGATESMPEEAPEPAVVTEDDLGLSYDRVQLPNGDLVGSAAALGNVHIRSDRDDTYRRASLVSRFDGRAVPTFALAMYAVGRSEGAETQGAAADEGAGTEPAETQGAKTQGAAAGQGAGPRTPLEVTREARDLRVGDLSVPVDDRGRSVIGFTRPVGGLPEYKADLVLQSSLQVLGGESPQLDPEVFRNRYVLVGLEAAGLFDLRPSPVYGFTPGVEIHATILGNLLEDRFVEVPPMWMRLLYTGVIVFVAGVAAALVSRPVSTVLVYVVGIPFAFVVGLAALAGGFWLPVAAPTVGALVGIAGSVVWGYATEGRRRRFIKGAFGQYLSPTVIESLIADPSWLRLGGIRREISVFFSDVQGFTTISEALAPEDLTALLNDYLTAMTDIVLERGGTIDKYEGDAIIAFWNAPLEERDHARRAVTAALECQRRLAELRPDFRERVGRDLFMRVGINTGPAVVGNFGSTLRFDYTMLGDTVNLGARLEGVNKQFGTYTMISEATKGAIDVEHASRAAVGGAGDAAAPAAP
ncbi:MAG: CHASE2 domain-containing protein, partial [Spirochaetaceae bacterium]